MTENEFREKTLAAITTYGKHGFIDLSLTKLKSFGLNCAVFDDGSKSERLKEVCDKHGVYLSGLYKRRPNITNIRDVRLVHSCGDVLSTVDAMNYAVAHGYKFVIKISRSLICLEDPIPSLYKLYVDSEGSTFTNFTTSWGMGFRTELTAYNMDYWSSVMHNIGLDALRDNGVGLVEAFMHNYARKVQPTSDKYRAYISAQEEGPVAGSDSYVHWHWMGTDKRNCPKHILWHDSNTPRDYLKACEECELSDYNTSDFEHSGSVGELLPSKNS